jgi:hypothetical protein
MVGDCLEMGTKEKKNAKIISGKLSALDKSKWEEVAGKFGLVELVSRPAQTFRQEDDSKLTGLLGDNLLKAFRLCQQLLADADKGYRHRPEPKDRSGLVESFCYLLFVLQEQTGDVPPDLKK